MASDDGQGQTLDALGLLCPLPVLKIRKRLQGLPPGAVLEVLADDPAAAVDIPHFCHEAGHSVEVLDDSAFPRALYQITKGG